MDMGSDRSMIPFLAFLHYSRLSLFSSGAQEHARERDASISQDVQQRISRYIVSIAGRALREQRARPETASPASTLSVGNARPITNLSG